MQDILLFFALGMFTGFIIGYLIRIYKEYKDFKKEVEAELEKLEKRKK